MQSYLMVDLQTKTLVDRFFVSTVEDVRKVLRGKEDLELLRVGRIRVMNGEELSVEAK